MNLRTFFLAGALALAALSTAACGKTVEPGNAGAKIRTFGPDAGVDREALPTGWHMTGIGERVEQYPTVTRTYSYTREADERGAENEEIVFTDRTGLPMTADVSVTLAVEQRAVPRLYTTYRLTFDQLLDGPIRNDVRTAIAKEAEQVGVEQLLAGGRQLIIQRAFARVRDKWARHGVVISQLDWIGAIRFPDVIQASIKARTKADQDVFAAQARVAVAEAEGRVKVAAAEADARAYTLRAQALTPLLLQQQAITKWDGKLPAATGDGAVPFLNLRSQ